VDVGSWLPDVPMEDALGSRKKGSGDVERRLGTGVSLFFCDFIVKFLCLASDTVIYNVARSNVKPFSNANALFQWITTAYSWTKGTVD